MISINHIQLNSMRRNSCKKYREIGLFKFLSEGSLASGVRRIEAVTGIQALEITQRTQTDISLIAEKLKIRLLLYLIGLIV